MDEICAQAPGKLYIAGEYAVTNPASPAVLAAVGRWVTVRLRPVNAGGTAATMGNAHGVIASSQYPGKKLEWTRSVDGSAQAVGQEGVYDFAFSALRWADAYGRQKWGTGERPLYDCVISSQLDAPNGTKYGLGSSAAVCVAIVRAVLAFWRCSATRRQTGDYPPQEARDDSRKLVFKLAAIAHLRIQGNGSLGDVASSAFGGWLLYHSFDREWLASKLEQLRHGEIMLPDLLASRWPALGLQALHVDPRFHLLVGWSGTPASTEKLVAQAARPVDPEEYRRFVTASAECAALVAADLARGDQEALAVHMARNRLLLLRLSELRDVPIETDRLRAGIDAALSLGLASKTSGAGRGDCLIALEDLHHPVSSSALRSAWDSCGIRPLPLAIAPPSPSLWSPEALSGVPKWARQHDSGVETSFEEGTAAADRLVASRQRKEAHLRLADLQMRTFLGRGLSPASKTAPRASTPYPTAGFERVRLVRPTLPETRVAESDIATRIFGHTVSAPFLIEAMTGGTAHATRINCALALTANREGLALAFGSASLTAHDPSALEGFKKARELTHFPFFANINPSTPLAAVDRIIAALHPTALQVHVNAVQELVMPEGDRDFRWLDHLVRLKEHVDLPLIIKEIGFGWDTRSLRLLLDHGFHWIDIGGMGGTNFALIENARRTSLEGDYSWLADCGVSTVKSLINAQSAQRKPSSSPTQESHDVHLIASGGVRSPLDVLKSLALGASAVGVAGFFLTKLLHQGEEGLDRCIRIWKRQLSGLYALYGVKTTAEAHHIPFHILNEASLI